MPVNDRFTTQTSIQGSTVTVSSTLISSPGTYLRTVRVRLTNGNQESKSDTQTWALNQTITTDFVFSSTVLSVVVVDYDPV